MTYTQLCAATKKQILALPKSRALWHQKIVCHSVGIIPTGKKHDSGWGSMRLLVVHPHPDTRIRIIDCAADDIQLEPGPMWHIDCLPKSGILHFWCHGLIEIGNRMSSVHLRVVEAKP